MIGPLLLIAAQSISAEAAIETFVAACAASITDAAAFAPAAQRLGYVEVEQRGRAALFRAGSTELLHTPREDCALRGSLATRDDADAVINRVSAALGLPAPQPIAMHPAGWTRYRWPNADGEPPRFYLAARTIIDHQGPVSLELSIHRGPGE